MDPEGDSSQTRHERTFADLVAMGHGNQDFRLRFRPRRVKSRSWRDETEHWAPFQAKASKIKEMPGEMGAEALVVGPEACVI